MIKKALLPFAALGAVLTFGIANAHEAKVGQIEITDPYTRAMLPVAKVGGGYITITNNGPDDRLVSVTSDRAPKVELHEMKMKGPVMEMRELDGGIAIRTNGTVELKPGGYHLMFMDVPQPFKEGETIKATLMFEKAGPVDVEFPVGPVAGARTHDHSHEGHGQ
jgi:copper(I)-binding protein